MTMRFIITVAREAHNGSGAATTRLATIERNRLAPETLGLTLDEAKAILTDLQAAIVADQIAAHEIEERRCRGCEAARLVKGHRSLTCRTVFGTVQAKALRLRRCACGRDPSAGNRASFSPLADLLPERITPELLYLETRWGSLVSYGLAARMLGDVLPLGKPVAPERIRRHLHGVAAQEEARLGEEAGRPMWSGGQRELDELPLPNGPAYMGVDAASCAIERVPGSKWSRASPFLASAGTALRTKSRGRQGASLLSRRTMTGHADACSMCSPRRVTRQTKSLCSCPTAVNPYADWCRRSVPRPSMCWIGFTSPCA
jgi:hypothetical protein